MTRYQATITHHSIARARVVPVGDSLHQAKIRASREFSGEMADVRILIEDTHTPEIGDLLQPGNYAIVASRRVDADSWT